MVGMSEKLKTSLVGYGYWGAKVARNIRENRHYRLFSIIDRCSDKLRKAEFDYPRTATSCKIPKKADVVAVTVPTSAHYEIGKEVLENGQHLWITKPFTKTSEQAQELVGLAKENNVKIMVDHTYLYSQPIRIIKSVVDGGVIGEVNLIKSRRLGGIVREDCNVLEDLALHGISITNFILDGSDVTEVAFASVSSSVEDDDRGALLLNIGGVTYTADVSWFSSQKIRELFVYGDKGELFYDDVIGNTIEVNLKNGNSYRVSDIDGQEPLQKEFEHFAECIKEDKLPLSDGIDGAKMGTILEMINEEL